MSSPSERPPDNTDGDATYIEKNLRHRPTDLLLDESVGSEVIRAVWRRSIRLSIGVFLLFLVIAIYNSDLFTSSSRFSSDDDGGALIAAGLVSALIVFAVCWMVFLNSEKQEAISEWCVLLVGKAAAADSVYSHIVGKLADRKLPMQNYLARRTAIELGITGNRLVLVDGYHYVYVSVFSYGTSLYLGWSMWRVRKGSLLLAHYRNSSRGEGYDPIGRILRLDRVKAMREAVHAVCREALDAAVHDTPVREEYGFPNGLPPIEGLPYGTVPQPPPRP